MSEQVSRGASDLRKRYWQEHGRPPEGEGPRPDMGGPAYIPWLEALVKQLETNLKIEKQKHLDTSNWAEEQQDRADKAEADNERLTALRELQAEIEPHALHLELDVVMYKATPNLYSLADWVERFLTIMRSPRR